jgi:hypothetical protein
MLGDAGVRVTIDTGLSAETPEGRCVILPGVAVVEPKSPGPPSALDRLLWTMGYRPVRISKFCTSLAALDRQLPANKWARALRQPWTPVPTIQMGAQGPLPARHDRPPWRIGALVGA